MEIGLVHRYGFDLYGVKNGTAGEQLDAHNPLLGYFYLQDRFELEDVVLNLGLRVDYFDAQTDIIADPEHPMKDPPLNKQGFLLWASSYHWN